MAKTKTVVKVSVTGEKEKREVLKAVAKLEGINELSMDVEKGTLTVIGDADPVCIITCLRKKCGRCAEIQTVGPEKPKPKCPSPCRLPSCPPCRLPSCPPCRLPPCPPCGPYPYSDCGEYEANTCSIL